MKGSRWEHLMNHIARSVVLMEHRFSTQRSGRPIVRAAEARPALSRSEVGEIYADSARTVSNSRLERAGDGDKGNGRPLLVQYPASCQTTCHAEQEQTKFKSFINPQPSSTNNGVRSSSLLTSTNLTLQPLAHSNFQTPHLRHLQASHFQNFHHPSSFPFHLSPTHFPTLKASATKPITRNVETTLTTQVSSVMVLT
jgi:hypothetical protein